jgi:hypothetical protein
LKESDLMRMAKEAALALSILEQKQVVHRDIAARNFLGMSFFIVRKIFCYCFF